MGRAAKAVTYEQIKKIYALAKERGMDRDLLHEHVEMLTEKSSIKSLTKQEAIVLIDSLDGKTVGRPMENKATPKQIHYIFGLMKELGWVTDSGRPDTDRLNRFLQSDKTGFKLSDYRWLNVGTASNLIEALKSMASREKEAVAK